jgi:hypothetical protein
LSNHDQTLIIIIKKTLARAYKYPMKIQTKRKKRRRGQENLDKKAKCEGSRAKY